MDPKTNKGGKPICLRHARHRAGHRSGDPARLPPHLRAADNPKAKIGLPEIMVGIFPGAGGTTRLTRKMGAMAASALLLEGKLNPTPRRPRPQASWIEVVAKRSELVGKGQGMGPEAKDANIVKPWDEKGYKMPGGAPYHPSRAS